MRPVFESYSQTVSSPNIVDLDQSMMGWVHDYLSLVALRPGTCAVCLQWRIKVALYGTRRGTETVQLTPLRRTLASSP